jgi:hypothetical protein
VCAFVIASPGNVFIDADLNNFPDPNSECPGEGHAGVVYLPWAGRLEKVEASSQVPPRLNCTDCR